MQRIPRVAFFTDSFSEVNGVALTSRQFDSFALHRGYPFWSVHAGANTGLTRNGEHWTFELQRSGASFDLEKDLSFDLLIWRNRQRILGIADVFQPDLIHVTGPGDFGMMGAWLAYKLKVPLAASWHTNVHEYAGRRLERLLSFLPDDQVHKIGNAAEKHALYGAARFYKLASLLFAPNQELVEMLRAQTGLPCHLMQRGVDSTLFTPARRTPGTRPFTIGYVGRLSTEKNVRFLVRIEEALLEAGYRDFRFLIAGHGSDQEWLAQNMKHAEFTGVVKGEELARVYADMDVFAFPSHTDTFGNVILEALASGVPAVVTSGGGPKFLVQPGVTGFVARDDIAFIQCIRDLYDNRELQAGMSQAAREHALSISWDRVFERVYEAYASLPLAARAGST